MNKEQQNQFYAFELLQGVSFDENSVTINFSFITHKQLPFTQTGHDFNACYKIVEDHPVTEISWTFKPGNSEVNLSIILAKKRPDVLSALALEINSFGCGRGLEIKNALLLASALQFINETTS